MKNRCCPLPVWLRLAALAGPHPPAESLKQLEVFDDLELDQLLAEPLVTAGFPELRRAGPHVGVQYQQYPHPAGLRMTSRDNHWRAVYDKVPPPPPNHIRGRDKITIHEDTDGDGVFDRHKTFVDGLTSRPRWPTGAAGSGC